MITIHPIALPLQAAFATAKGSTSTRRGFIVRFEQDGLVGWGEASPFPGLSVETLDAVEAELMPLHGAHLPLPHDPDGLHALVYQHVSTAAAAHGLGTALLDCMAQRARLPLARLLNTRVHREVPISHLYTGDDDLIHATMLGCQTVKVKVGMDDVAADIERITKIRQLMGPDIHLRLDANGAWSEDEAARFIASTAGLGIRCIEDPIDPSNLQGMAKLRGRGVDIAADESIASAAAVKAVIDANAADVVVIKPMRVGTPLTAMAAIAVASDAGLDAFVTTTIDSAVGRMTALHIAAAAPTTGLRACGLNTGGWLAADIGTTPEMMGSHMDCPTQPGLGLRVST